LGPVGCATVMDAIMAMELVEKQVVYPGRKIRLEIHHLKDEVGNRYQHEVCVHNGAVVILPWMDAQTIVLIKNFRYAVGGPLVELPAGTLEKGEDPMNCAGRELLEETGFLAGRLTRLATFFTSPGVLSERMYAFAAFDLQRSVTALELGEQIEPLPTNFDEAVRMCGDGRIADAKTITTILMYERFFRNKV
jgi:ADP-ribose pyrophosphatase